MPLTPETLCRHELAGLPVRVVAAANRDLVGIEGTVVSETTKTLLIEVERDEDGEASDCRARSRVEKRVPKDGTTFEFTLTDEAAGDRKAQGITSEPDGDAVAAGEGVTHVTVDGARLLSRPARRTEMRGVSTWESA